MSVKQPHHIQLHVLKNKQNHAINPSTHAYPYAYSPTSPRELAPVVPNTTPQFDTVKTRSSSQHTIPTLETQETPEPNKPNKPSKCIGIGWFIWHTFDFITDILLGLQWTFGVSPTQDIVRQNCWIIDFKNFVGVIIGPCLLLFSIIGYIFYLRDAYKVYMLKIPMDDVAWRWLKIFKLFCEDAASITITCFCSVWFIQLSTIATISLTMSAISLATLIFKHIVYTPYRKGKGCCNKCAVFACCICWMGCIVSLFSLGYLVFITTVSDAEGVVYYKREDSEYCDDVKSLYDFDDGNIYVGSGVICTHESGQERFFCYTDAESEEDQAIISEYVYFESCKVFNVQEGRYEGYNITVCYDSLEPNLRYF